MTRRIDWALTLVLFGFGCLHNAVAFVAFDEITEEALFFVGAGLAMWFVVALNTARLRHGAANVDLAWLSFAANGLLAAIPVTGVIAIATFRSAAGWSLVATCVGLFVLSAMDLFYIRRLALR
jgi:hypothetical protein